MTKKIFDALKQEYHSLGLGDAILQAQAEALNATGLVTDENIASIVTSQKSWLESLQKSNDKRVADAIKKANADSKAAIDAAVADALKKAEDERKAAEEAKAKEEAEKAAAEAKAKEEAERLEALQKAKVSEEVQKLLEEMRKALEDSETARKTEVETYRKSMEEQIAKMLEENKTLSASMKTMQDEKAALEAAKAAEARQNLILSKAKELGVPQTRIDEGFAISSEMDETAITEYLTKVANNSKVMKLPTGGTAAPLANGEPDKAEIANLAASLIH